MMVVHRESGEIEHKKFKDILDYFEEEDVMVFNNIKLFQLDYMEIKRKQVLK